MLRKIALATAAATTAMVLSGPLSAAETVRIETRPFYGATVTLEEGVRVFRPLPADKRVIINPGGRTPLSLNFLDAKSESHNYSTNEHNYHHGGAAHGDDSEGFAGAGYPRYGASRLRGGHRPRY